MRYKKMTNPTDGINQTNKQLSTVEDQLCCINDNLITGVPIAAGPQLDSFGRLRVSEPLTLFDSSHRFDDNDLWSTATATGGEGVYASIDWEEISR